MVLRGSIEWRSSRQAGALVARMGFRGSGLFEASFRSSVGCRRDSYEDLREGWLGPTKKISDQGRRNGVETAARIVDGGGGRRRFGHYSASVPFTAIVVQRRQLKKRKSV